MSSKSIIIILSYTVSRLAHFLRYSVVSCMTWERFCTEKLELEINTSAVRIFFEISSYLLFDSKLTQLFEIFEYSFNCDQPGDWDAICLYFASHKPLYSPVSWTQCCAACVPTPPTPLTTAWELLQAAAWTVTLDRVITAGGKHSARSVEH